MICPVEIASDMAALDPGGTGVARIGGADDSGLLAAGTRAQRAQLLDLAGTIAAGTKTAPDRQPGAANIFPREHYMAEFSRRFQVAGAQRGSAFLPCRRRDLNLIFALQFERTVNRDNTASFQNLSLQIERVRWRASLAGCPAVVHQHLDGNLSLTHGPHCLGTIHGAGRGTGDAENAGAMGCGKDAGWKNHKADFPTPLGNPANCAGFPLSHSPDGCWLIMKLDISRATKSGHFNLLATPGLPSAHGVSSKL
jgi:hypothetical protein